MNELEYNITIRKKNNGLQVIVSYKDGLKWKQKSKQGFEDNREGKKEAKIYADKIVQSLKKEANLVKTKSILTFEEFKDIYLQHKKIHLAANSYVNKKKAIEVFKDLNTMEIKKILKVDIQNIVDKLIKKGYKTSTIKVYVGHVFSLFSYAEQNNYIVKNPVKNIQIPKEKVKREKRALTKSEYDDFLSKILDHPKIYTASYIAGSCGLRIGEVLGLTWEDIDWENKLIDVNKQWVLTPSGNYAFDVLKSPNSYRKVPIPQNLLTHLECNKSDDLTERIVEYGSTASFCSILKRYYKSIGYDISVHELRHTYATRLIENGMNPKSASQLLGHEAKITMEKYAHFTKDMLDDANDFINKFF